MKECEGDLLRVWPVLTVTLKIPCWNIIAKNSLLKVTLLWKMSQVAAKAAWIYKQYLRCYLLQVAHLFHVLLLLFDIPFPTLHEVFWFGDYSLKKFEIRSWKISLDENVKLYNYTTNKKLQNSGFDPKTEFGNQKARDPCCTLHCYPIRKNSARQRKQIFEPKYYLIKEGKI